MPVVINGSTGISGVDGSAATPAFQGSDTNTGIRFGTDIVSLVTSGSDRLYIDSSGKLGVGSTSPSQSWTGGASQVLQLQGPAATITVLRVNESGGTYGDLQLVCSSSAEVGVYNFANGAMRFGTNGNERLRIDSSGRLLVGTSSSPTVGDPQYGLVRIQGNTSSASGFGVLSIGRGQAAASISSGSELGHIYFTANDGSPYASISGYSDAAGGSNDYPGRLTFSTTADGASSPTERMRIQADGQIRVTNNNTNIIYVNTGANGTALCYFQTASAELGKIRINGAGVAYDTTSDYRLKENLEPIADATTRVQALKPWRFNFISHPEATVDGFLAHEAQEVVPEAVGGQKDAVDDNGNPLYQGIDQSKLVPLLTAALQESIKRIEQLEATNASFEARLSALEVNP